MPLMHGKGPKAFEHNIKTEMHHDKPLKQSLAIAYAMKRKAKKHDEHEDEEHKAHGGFMMKKKLLDMNRTNTAWGVMPMAEHQNLSMKKNALATNMANYHAQTVKAAIATSMAPI